MTNIKGTLRTRGTGAAAGIAVLVAGALLAGCGGSGPATTSGARSSGAQASGAQASSDQSSSARPSSARPSASAAGGALATRVCDGARRAAAKAFGAALSGRIVSPAASDLQCLLTGKHLRVAIESQAGPRAYAEFDTETSHQSQVFGNGGAHNPAQDPVEVTVPGSQVAVWIPAQAMVAATDSTPDNGGGGAYVTVTVTVTRQAVSAKTALSVAQAAAAATFAAKPDGPG